MKSRYVLPSETGESPLNANNFTNRVWKPALKKAGIEDLHWHDLRHTFASRLIMAGVDLRTVQELMGHKTITMTLRYSHLSPTHQREAVQRLSQDSHQPQSGLGESVLSIRKTKWSRRESNPRPLECHFAPEPQLA
jgi:site-specific recombinase XerD